MALTWDTGNSDQILEENSHDSGGEGVQVGGGVTVPGGV